MASQFTTEEALLGPKCLAANRKNLTTWNAYISPPLSNISNKFAEHSDSILHRMSGGTIHLWKILREKVSRFKFNFHPFVPQLAL